MRSRARRVVVVGDVLLDRDLQGRVERICPDAPAPVVDVDAVRESPGAAGLTALLCRRPGVHVTLVAPVADDPEGAKVTSMVRAGGIELIALGHEGATRCKTRVRCDGQTLMRLDDGGPATPVGGVPDEAGRAIRQADVVLVSCYGAGTSGHGGVRALLTERARERPVIWDPHPRGAKPVPGCAVVTPNLAEALAATRDAGCAADEAAHRLVRSWQAAAVCVTVGGAGAWLATPDEAPTLFGARSVETGDPCGAGDRFAASVATALAGGADLGEAVAAAVRDAAGWVAAGGAAGYRDRSAGGQVADLGELRRAAAGGDEPVDVPGAAARGEPAAQALAARVRGRGGTVVATGGCFDVLHAGHLQCLQAARRLGDALIVLVNSDASVRRLKGPGRPVCSAADRVQLLAGLSCVDAVLVFEEDDPREVLARLRPDVWAKGGDYARAPLTEAGLVRGWGGRVVLLPHLPGRSTTAILHAVR